MADALDKAVQQNSGSVNNRGAANAVPSQATTDLLDQLVSMQTQMDRLQKQKESIPTNTAGQMGTGQSLLAMLGSMGVAAGGQPEMAQGMLNQFQQKGAQAAQLEGAKLDAARAETMDMLDKNRQRLIQVYQTSPESFINPETGQSVVDPRVLGYAMTGMKIPINPGVNYNLMKQTEADKNAVEIGINLLMRGDTPAKRKQGAMMLNSRLKLNLDDQFFVDIMGMDETQAWDSLLGKAGLDTAATLSAWNFALENHLSLTDPKVVSILHGAADTSGGELTVDKYTISLIGKLNRWVAAAGPEVHSMSIDDQIANAFGNEAAGDKNLLLKFFHGTDAFNTGLDPLVIAQTVGQYADIMAKMWTLSNGQNSWLKGLGINNPDDIWTKAGELATSKLGWVQQASRDMLAQDTGQAVRDVAMRLATEPANQNADMGTLMSGAGDIIRQIKEKHTSPTGRLDVDAFKKDVRAYVDTAVAAAPKP